jgi:transglutaminase-like putative cysteine protease
MKLKLFGLLTLLMFLMLIFSGCVENSQIENNYRSTDNPILNVKSGVMSFNVTIRTNESTKTARLWIPYPVSNEYQKIENIKINGNYNYSGIHKDGVSGNTIIYAEWKNPKDFPELNFSFNVTRTEIFRKNFPNDEGSIPMEISHYLESTSLGPTNGIVKEISDEVTKGKTTILSKATVIYDYLVEHGERDANLSFCGDGDVCELLKNLRGKCVDFSSVFVALARTAGVPAREILGTRIYKNGDITGAYHCRAEFYLPNYGWVSVDPSDIAKLMLNENLDINDTKVLTARDYFFGAQTETYIDLSTGRDITLNPEQDAGPLNYFMYPYAEVDGEPLDFISQEYLKYTVTFNEK